MLAACGGQTARALKIDVLFSVMVGLTILSVGFPMLSHASQHASLRVA